MLMMIILYIYMKLVVSWSKSKAKRTWHANLYSRCLLHDMLLVECLKFPYFVPYNWHLTYFHLLLLLTMYIEWPTFQAKKEKHDLMIQFILNGRLINISGVKRKKWGKRNAKKKHVNTNECNAKILNTNSCPKPKRDKILREKDRYRPAIFLFWWVGFAKTRPVWKFPWTIHFKFEPTSWPLSFTVKLVMLICSKTLTSIVTFWQLTQIKFNSITKASQDCDIKLAFGSCPFVF